MNKDPILRQLVDDQDWHVWMDDRRSLLSYPAVSDFCSLRLPVIPLPTVRLTDTLHLAFSGIVG